MRETLEEKSRPLISLTGAPLIWAGHFVVLYAVAGTLCQKLEAESAITIAQWVTAVATVFALGGIAWVAWHSALRLRKEIDRRFMARVTLMLAGLSAVAVVFNALPAVLSASCQ